MDSPPAIVHLALEWICLSCVQSIIGDYIQECIVHVATLTSMISIWH